MVVTDKHVLFWGEEFSNFYPAPIRYIDGAFTYIFPTSEHLFMWLKAKYFGDEEIAHQIACAETPQKAKKLGRKVRNFNNEEWAKVRYDKMLEAVTYKFSQNPILEQKLTSLEYEGRSFVEASPFDTIWGIGLDETNPYADDESKWLGLNLLGKCLDEVRKSLI